MREHWLEVADVFRAYEQEYFAQWGHVLGPHQKKAFERFAIAARPPSVVKIVFCYSVK
jgi:hypothetical protein